METRLASRSSESLKLKGQHLNALSSQSHMPHDYSDRRKQAIQTLLASPFWNIPSVSPKAFLLYEQALTHSTYAKERRDQGYSCADNERLEFLGDRILNCAVADFLYRQYNEASEGDLSAKIKFTQNANFAHIVKKQTPDIKRLLRLGKGQSLTDAILADTFEALIGAIYLDPDQGLPKIHQLVSGPLALGIKAFTTEEDCISRLQIHVQKLLKKDRLTSDDLDYVEVSHSIDSQNNHTYTYEVKLQGKASGQGTGSNVKAAKQAAAKVAFHQFGVGLKPRTSSPLLLPYLASVQAS